MVIPDIDQVECHQSNIHFKQKFINAQKMLQLMNCSDDNDYSRLKRCIGLIFAEFTAQVYVYKIFGFPSVVEQASFARDNCRALFTWDNLSKVTLQAIKVSLENTIQKFEINNVTQLENSTITLIRKSINALDVDSWNNFRISLYENITSNKTGG